MLYIDNTYFVRKLSIPRINEPTSDASIELEESIDGYVSQFFRETLGNVLFEDLKSNTTDGELDVLAPQKWLNLINGCEYTKDGKTFTWQGVKYEDGAFKVSLLANYVYLNHFNNTHNSQLGTIMLDGKNAVNVDSTPHLVDIFNDFVDMYQGKYNCQPYKSYRNGVMFVDYYGNRESGYVSYLQFLKDNETDYSNIPAQSIEYKNSWGL